MTHPRLMYWAGWALLLLGLPGSLILRPAWFLLGGLVVVLFYEKRPAKTHPTTEPAGAQARGLQP